MMLPFSDLSSPDQFEQLCARLVERLPGVIPGSVHRYGTPGEKQHGIDIEADFATPDGRKRVVYQCKRYQKAGLAQLEEWVTAVIIPHFRRTFPSMHRFPHLAPVQINLGAGFPGVQDLHVVPFQVVVHGAGDLPPFAQ